MTGLAELPDDSERRLTEALRARATGGVEPGRSPQAPGVGSRRSGSSWQLGVALLTLLLVGVALGAGLALLSLLVPGVLSSLG